MAREWVRFETHKDRLFFGLGDENGFVRIFCVERAVNCRLGRLREVSRACGTVWPPACNLGRHGQSEEH
jgi:hypothetical protein